MENYFQMFRQYLQQHRIIFTDIDVDMLVIEYRGQALEKIPLVCYIPSQEPAQCFLVCSEVVECVGKATPEALEICNLINRCSLPANVHIDDDGKVCVCSIIRVHKEYFCEDIMEALCRLAETADATYMQFQERME